MIDQSRELSSQPKSNSSGCLGILDPALDLKQNYFIEASAGTGKTFTIENCVVRLAQQGIPIDKILVVTFTRAATLELKTRIRKSLQAKGLHQELLRFEEAKIFTIHGFCFHTLKEHAMESGFLLSQNKESASAEMPKKIFKDFLRTSLSPEEFHPHQLAKLFKSYPDQNRLFKEVMQPARGIGRSYTSLQLEIEQEIAKLALSSTPLLEELLQQAPKFGKMCDRKKQLKEENREGLRTFVSLFEGNWEGWRGEAILKMVPENLLQNKGPYPELLCRLHAKLIPLLKEVLEPANTLDLLKMRFSAFLSYVCSQEDLFFYDDLLAQMHRCVANPSFAQKVRASYQAVLIDEFQDTDKIQWEIFSTLFLDHLPLFLVGDPKQSIYRFRGADLYTYMEAKKAVGEKGHQTLIRNFRADPLLIDGLNSLFRRTPLLMPLPKTQEFISIPEIEAGRASEGLGKIIFCEACDERALFNYITCEIDRLHQEEGVAYKECAVLVKDHAQAKRFSAQCPLPIAPRRVGSLLESKALLILEDLLQGVCDPYDRHAVAKALGGPLFGISVENLHESLELYLPFFYSARSVLQEEGILSFFQMVVKKGVFYEEALYGELLQLIELIAEEGCSFEKILSFIESLKLEDPESERLKSRAKGGGDGIPLMTIHVSKGLEFAVVFPVGLMCSYEMEGEEERSERMRQLYVSLTRAKRRLYIPLSEKENSPIAYFLSQVLQGESLESWIAKHPFFEKVSCEIQEKKVVRAVKEPSVLEEVPPYVFPPSRLYSYSSLAEKKEGVFHTASKEGDVPPGTETGILLHRLFEHLDFQLTGEKLRRWIARHLEKTPLENYAFAIETLVQNALEFPLPHPDGPFCLAQVSPEKMRREMEFLYPSLEPAGYIKGFIDLFFEHKGRYYGIDWKSNFLEGYSPAHLREAITHYNYDLQGRLYKEALLRYLKLTQRDSQFEGLFYFFLRGLNPKTHEGILGC